MGETFASRVAASLLASIGLPQLITRNLDDYFELCKALAKDTPRRRQVRDRLVQQRGSAPLFDAGRFARDLERLYLLMWQQHQSGVRETITLAAS